MKSLTKLLSVLLSVSALSLAACSGDGNTGESSTLPDSDSTTPTTDVNDDDYMTLSEVLADPQEGVLYTIKAVIGEVTNTTYGNSTLYDADTGESIVLWGLSGDETSLTQDDEGVWSFDNPQDYSENVAGQFETGDEIIIQGIYYLYSTSYLTTPEFMGVFLGVNRSVDDIAYAITIDDSIENGSVSLSSSTGTYGEWITVTATPDEGYNLTGLTVNGSNTSTDEEGNSGFNVVPGPNVVSATFSDEATTSVAITTDVLNIPSQSYTDGDVSLQVDGTSVGLSFVELGNYTHGIQWRIGNSATSALWNTSAFPYAIESITFNFNSYQSSTVSRLAVSFGTSEITENASTTDVAYTNNATDVTVTAPDTSSTFFRINHSVNGAFYIDSIVINFVSGD